MATLIRLILILLLFAVPAYSADNDVVFENVSGATATGNEIQGNAASWGGGNAVASFSQDGSVSFKIKNAISAGDYAEVCLAQSKLTPGTGTPDYCWYFIGDSAKAVAYIDGVAKYDSGSYVAGTDVFKIQRSGTSVIFKKNGSTLYTGTSQVNAGETSYVLCWVYDTTAIVTAAQTNDFDFGVPSAVTALTVSPNATTATVNVTAPGNNGYAISNYRFYMSLASSGTWDNYYDNGTSTSYQWTGLSGGTSYKFQARATNSSGDGPIGSAVTAATGSIEYVRWVNLDGTNVADNSTGTLNKPSGSNAWNSNGNSYRYLYGDCALDFTVGTASKAIWIGLSADNGSGGSTIDYSMTSSSANNMYIFENNVQKGGGPWAYTTTDRFRIERTGTNNGTQAGTIKYYLNGALLYTSLSTSSGPILVDACMNTVGGTINSAQMSDYMPNTSMQVMRWF